MRHNHLAAVGVVLSLVVSAGRSADVDTPKKAATPEEALKLLCEYAKEGNIEGHLSVWAEPSRTFFKAALESENSVAILQRALDDKLGNKTKDMSSGPGGLWIVPGKQDGRGYFAFIKGMVPDGMKAFPQYHKGELTSKETRLDGTVVLSLKDEKGTMKFTAKNAGAGWQLIQWQSDLDSSGNIVLFEPTAKSAAACRKLHEQAKAVLLQTAREVEAGKINRRDAAWGKVYDTIQAIVDPETTKLSPDVKPELAPPPTKN